MNHDAILTTGLQAMIHGLMKQRSEESIRNGVIPGMRHDAFEILNSDFLFYDEILLDINSKKDILEPDFDYFYSFTFNAYTKQKFSSNLFIKSINTSPQKFYISPNAYDIINKYQYGFLLARMNQTFFLEILPEEYLNYSFDNYIFSSARFQYDIDSNQFSIYCGMLPFEFQVEKWKEFASLFPKTQPFTFENRFDITTKQYLDTTIHIIIRKENDQIQLLGLKSQSLASINIPSMLSGLLSLSLLYQAYISYFPTFHCEENFDTLQQICDGLSLDNQLNYLEHSYIEHKTKKDER